MAHVEQSGAQKQRLRLSAYAWSIMEQDRMNFSQDGNAVSKAGLLNRIFLNFYEHAGASIPLRLKERMSEWDKMLDSEESKAVLEKLGSGYKSELQTYIKQLCSGGASEMAWNLTLQVETSKLLDDLLKRGFFSIELGAKITRGKYMAAIFEEYAKMPYVERERVYFEDTYENIEDAITHERPIIITYVDKPLYVMPYSLETDKLSMYNYLIGYARSATSTTGELDGSEFSLESFRLSKIKRVEIDRRQMAGSGSLSLEQRSRINDSRVKHGTMFIADDDKIFEIRVRLTDEGRKKYINQVHMRPPRLNKRDEGDDGATYVFNCTLHQAEAYFFKFGTEAEILSPSVLRERFAQEFAKAAKLYV